MATIQTGKFESGGQLWGSLQVNRDLHGMLGSQQYLGTFSSQDGNHNLIIYVKDIVADEIAHYKLFTNRNVPQASWNSVAPADGKPRDYALLFRVDGSIVTVRIDRLNEVAGKKTYVFRVFNLRPEIEHFDNRVMDTYHHDIPHPAPDNIPHPPAPMPTPNVNELVLGKLKEHTEAPAPHSGHEIILRKNQANGYAGLDSNGKLTITQFPQEAIKTGVLKIIIGSQVITYDGYSDVIVNLSTDSSEGQTVINELSDALSQNLNTDSAASEDDIAALFDDDPNTPYINPNDPGRIFTENSGQPNPENSEQPNPENSEQPNPENQGNIADDSDIDDIFG